jgi:hypothetical protein
MNTVSIALGGAGNLRTEEGTTLSRHIARRAVVADLAIYSKEVN